jgi:hypothetical protein
MENKKPAEAGFLLSAGNSTRDESTRSLLLTPARGVTQQPQAGQHHGIGFGFGDGGYGWHANGDRMAPIVCICAERFEQQLIVTIEEFNVVDITFRVGICPAVNGYAIEYRGRRQRNAQMIRGIPCRSVNLRIGTGKNSIVGKCNTPAIAEIQPANTGCNTAVARQRHIRASTSFRCHNLRNLQEGGNGAVNPSSTPNDASG